MSDPRCVVCSRPLPVQEGPGQPRKTCRDEDSPTPGGCARWRNIEQTAKRDMRGRRASKDFSAHDRLTIDRYFTDIGHGFIIE